MSLDWPDHIDRTPEGDREGDYVYSVSLSQAFTDLEKQLDLLGASSYEYEFDAPQRQVDKRPYSDATFSDPGFVLTWTMNDTEYMAACDQYTGLRGNVRTVGLWLEEKRKMGDRAVKTTQSEFANARLPPGDGEQATARPPADDTISDPYAVLNVSEDASEEIVEAAARRLQKKYSPDSNEEPDREMFKRVTAAKEQLLND